MSFWSPTLLKTPVRVSWVRVAGVRLRRAASLFLLLCTALHLYTPALQAATDVPACGFAEILGVVTAEDSGLPLADVDVEGEGKEIDADTTSNVSGRYTLTLPIYRDKGPYQITFIAPNDSPYLSLPPATTQVSSGTTTIVNAVLPRGGTIVGQVTTADTGQPMEGVRIRASTKVILEDNDPFVSSTNTDADGRYVLQGLKSEGYVLRYNTHDVFSSDVISTYATSFVGGGNYPSVATVFTVTAPHTTTVNFTIAPGRKLAGEVRRADNDVPVPDVQVGLYWLDEDGSGRGDSVQQTETDSMGVYEFEGLAPGDYLIHARPQRAILGPQLPNADLKAAWHGNVPNSDEAQVVEISEVNSAQTISLNLTLEVGASITGVVTDGDTGTPVEGIGVDVRPPIGLQEVTRSLYQIRTDASGVYTIPGLYAGTYGIISDAAFTPYGGIGRDSFTGITLTVGASGITPNVNFTVARAGEIEGIVSNEQGVPLPSFSVLLISPTTGRLLRTTTSNDSGAYRFSFVAPGEYHIKYDRFDPCGCYNNEYYSGDASEDISVVVVEPSKTTTGINALLACNAPPVDEVNLYMPLIVP